jgi:hypothetical protein
MKCVIYCRVSTDRQREAGTIESQRELLLLTARTNDWTVVSVEEDDGFSGTVPAWERPGMSRALRLIEQRAVDYLLVVDLDRTSRAEDPFERAIVRKALRDHGVLLATPKGILRDITPEEKLTQGIHSANGILPGDVIRARLAEYRALVDPSSAQTGKHRLFLRSPRGRLGRPRPSGGGQEPFHARRHPSRDVRDRPPRGGDPRGRRTPWRSKATSRP